MNSDRRRDRLREIHRVAESLREEVAAPDLTDAIIQRVHEQRPFLEPDSRRVLTWCKVGAASLALVVAGAVFVIRATTPEMQSMVSPAQPVVFTPAVDSVRESAVLAAERFRVKLDSIERLATQPLIVVYHASEKPNGEYVTVVASRADAVPGGLESRTESGVASGSFVYTSRGGDSTGAAATLHIEYVDSSDLSDYPPFAGSQVRFAALNGVPKPAGSPTSWQFESFPVGRLRQPRYISSTVIRVGDRGTVGVMGGDGTGPAVFGCDLLDDFAPLITGQPPGEGLIPR